MLEHVVGEKLGAPRVEEEIESGGVVDEEGVRYFLLVPPTALEEIRGQLNEIGFDEVEVLGEREGDLVDVVAFQRGEIPELRSAVDEIETKLTAR